MGGLSEFWSDFGDGFSRPFKWGYGQVSKRVDQADKLVDKASSGADNLLDLLGGNSNILVYAGIGIVGLIVVTTVLPKLIDRAV